MADPRLPSLLEVLLAERYLDAIWLTS